MEAKAYISSQMNQTMVNVSRKKMVYWERKNSHRCVRCNKPNEDGKASCPECRAKDNEDARQARLFLNLLVCVRNVEKTGYLRMKKHVRNAGQKA